MADVTVADLMQDTWRHLTGVARGEANLVGSTVATTDTVVNFTYPTNGINRGGYLNIDDEVMYVWAVNTSAQQATVQRGMRGSTPAAHTSGTWVDVNPRFPAIDVRNALQEEIRSWPAELFQVKSLDLTEGTLNISTPNQIGVQRAFDLNGIDPNFYGGLDLMHSPKSFSDTWYRITRWDIRRLPTSGPGNVDSSYPIPYYPSGFALIVKDPRAYTGQLHLLYAAPFNTDAFLNTSNLASDVGLAPQMLDIPPLGAAWRLLATREIRRTFTESQGQSRHAEEVPPEEIMKAAMALKSLRDNRIGQEVERLLAQYPYRTLGA